MRIETPPRKIRTYTFKEVAYIHEPVIHLTPQAGFIKCPHCQNGVAKQMVDGKDLIWGCIMCGWQKPTREPDMKHYGEDKVDYEKRY